MSNFASLVFYIALFGLSAVLLYVAEEFFSGYRRRIVAAVGLAIPILIAGLRYAVGIDYWSYDVKFKTVAQSSIGDLIGTWGHLNWNYMEPSFFIISKLAGLVTDGSWLMFAVYASVSILFFYLGLKKLGLRYSAFVFFLILVLFFPQSFNAVRQFAALAILFYATVTLVQSGRLKTFIGWSILAFFFHYTSILYAIICIAVYLLKRKDRSTAGHLRQMVILPLMILATALAVFFLAKAGLLTEKVRIMADSVARSSITFEAWLSTLFNNGIKLLALLPFYDKITKRHAGAHIYFLLFAIGTSMFLLMPISHIFFFRISLYFTIFFVVLLGYLLESIDRREIRRYLMIFLAVFAVASFTRANYLNDSIQIVPYQTIITISETSV